MSRRDTIIIAVLVNAALLMILFATAMRSDPKVEGSKGDRGSHTKFGELAVAPLGESHSHEDLLNEFVSSTPTLAETGQDNLFSFDEATLELATPSTPVIELQPIPHQSTQEVREARPRLDEHYVHVAVKKGDFLEKIAKGNNTSIAAIMKANNLASTQLKVGQVLKIPLSDGAVADKKPSPAAVTSLSGEFYTVKEGDNPWLIASRNKINLEELLRLNGLDDQKAKRLRPGDKLRIR